MIDPIVEPDSAAERRRVTREMTALALSKGFSLKHGLEEPANAEELSAAQAELAQALRERREREAELLAGAKVEKEEKSKRQSANSDLELSFFLSRYEEPSALSAELKNFDAAQSKKEQALAMRILRLSGAWDRLSDPSWREKMRLLAGEHKSQMELRASESELENRLDHYSITARRSPEGVFERFDTVDWKDAHGKLASDVTEKGLRKRPLAMGHILGLSSKPAIPPNAQTSVLALLEAKGAPAFHAPKTEKDNSLAVVFNLSDDVRTSEEALEASDRLAQWCEQGGWASVCAQIAQGAPSGSELAQAGAWMQEVMSGAQALAQEDKARRICEWFDQQAGERSSELAQKVWGASIPAGLRLGELETLARRSQELWAALEGQEALRLFSIRMSEKLGLELTGRDLAERAKEKMKRVGLTDGGWRLLGKLDSSADGETAQWMGWAKEDPHDERLRVGFMLDVFRRAGLAENDEQNEAERKAARERQRQEREAAVLGMMAKTLSACSARGIDAPGAQRALSALRRCGAHSAARLFGESVEAPEGVSAEDAAAERSAKAARTPKILGDWAALAAKDPAKALESLREALDWAREAEWGVWRDMPESAGWKEIMARQKRWHEMVQERERSKRSAISWDPLSPGWSDPQTGFSATPLTDGGMLWDEGKAMRHCVSSYASRCEEGECRIFSIRKDGERFGTAEVAIADGSFKVVQFKGVCNRSIEDERAWAAAKAAARQCQEAVALKSAALNAALDADLTAKLRARRADSVAATALPLPAPGAP